MKKLIAALMAMCLILSGCCFALTKDEVELPRGVMFGMTVGEASTAAGGAKNARYYYQDEGGVNWELITARAEACGRENPAYLGILSSKYGGYAAMTDCYFDTDGYLNSAEIKFKPIGTLDYEEQFERYDSIEATLTENFGEASEEIIEAYPRTFAPYVANLMYTPVRFTTRLVTLDDGTVLYIEHCICGETAEGSDSVYYEHWLGFTVIQ